MVNSGCFKVISFNCFSFNYKLQVVRVLCLANDVVVLQETWLVLYDFCLLTLWILTSSLSLSQQLIRTSQLQADLIWGLSVVWQKNLGKGIELLALGQSRY